MKTKIAMVPCNHLFFFVNKFWRGVISLISKVSHDIIRKFLPEKLSDGKGVVCFKDVSSNYNHVSSLSLVKVPMTYLPAGPRPTVACRHAKRQEAGAGLCDHLGFIHETRDLLVAARAGQPKRRRLQSRRRKRHMTNWHVCLKTDMS